MRKTQTAQALLILTLVAGCGGAKEAAKDTAAMAPAAAPAPAPKTAADFAGTWQATSQLPNSKPVQSTLTIAADGKASITLEGRPNINATVSISGDSVVTVSDEYESVLRKGVKVVTRTASVRNGDNLTGTIEATYKTAKGEEKVNGTITGARKP